MELHEHNMIFDNAFINQFNQPLVHATQVNQKQYQTHKVKIISTLFMGL